MWGFQRYEAKQQQKLFSNSFEKFIFMYLNYRTQLWFWDHSTLEHTHYNSYNVEWIDNEALNDSDTRLYVQARAHF